MKQYRKIIITLLISVLVFVSCDLNTKEKTIAETDESKKNKIEKTLDINTPAKDSRHPKYSFNKDKIGSFFNKT